MVPLTPCSFPQALFLIYFYIYLSTESDGLKRHHLFFFFSPSERTHILGMQRQRCGSSDASRLPWPRSRIPSRIYRTLKCERLKCHLVTIYRWGRDRAQWLLDVFLPLPSGKLWITTKGIS